MARGQDQWWKEPPWWAWAVLTTAIIAIAAMLPFAFNRQPAPYIASAEVPQAAVAAVAPTLVNADGTVGPVVALGDSLTAGVDPGDTPFSEPPNEASPRSWYTQALAADGRLTGAFNAGIPGDLTTGMLTRFDRDVTAHHAKVVVIMGGTNDLDQNHRTPQEVMQTLQQLVQRAQSIGAVPVLATIPPRSGAAYVEPTRTLNDLIKTYGQQQGLTVIDFYSVVAGPDGDWLDGYSQDGIHSTAKGAKAMGDLADKTLLPAG